MFPKDAHTTQVSPGVFLVFRRQIYSNIGIILIGRGEIPGTLDWKGLSGI